MKRVIAVLNETINVSRRLTDVEVARAAMVYTVDTRIAPERGVYVELEAVDSITDDEKAAAVGADLRKAFHRRAADSPAWPGARLYTLYGAPAWFDAAGWLIRPIPAAAVAACSHSGPCDADVAYWRARMGFAVPRDAAIKWLQECGAWWAEELAALSDDDLADRVLWLATGDIKAGGDFLGLVY